MDTEMGMANSARRGMPRKSNLNIRMTDTGRWQNNFPSTIARRVTPEDDSDYRALLLKARGVFPLIEPNFSQPCLSRLNQ